MRDVIRQKLADAVRSELPALTRRGVRLPAVSGKTHAVIGMRRAGKTCFLHQVQRDRVDKGAPRETQVYFNFDDERLAGMDASQLHWLLEEYFLRFPQHRDQRTVAFYLDEIQVVRGWESFVRRVMDTEKIDLFVSGSSAKMLSREVATALRGRAMETLVHPFSFREFLRHQEVEPDGDPSFLPKAQRSRVEKLFGEFLLQGGFPEAQGLATEDRLPLLQGYVDSVILRDVIERHGVANVVALRHLTRQLLGAAAGLFSVHRFFNDQKSQGVAVSKDALHAMLGHLEDAFLIRLVPMHTSSERQRQSNPRKAYPVDSGLITAFDRSGKPNTGHALETAVLVELERRKCERAYVRTASGAEVDFLATPLTGRPTLIQVCADMSDPTTRAREFRALTEAMAEHKRLPGLILTATSTGLSHAQAEAPKGVTIRAAWEWMLDTGTS
ncbi:MAG: ATP-binding protein [Verrucomicrobiaceae bacterium]|nr:ATP-binding protein [Verrucomicrobiaceae bacterium]